MLLLSCPLFLLEISKSNLRSSYLHKTSLKIKDSAQTEEAKDICSVIIY